MTAHIEAPEHAGFRDQAESLAATLGSDMREGIVMLDCTRVLVGTPSFLDEVVRQVLVERHAHALHVQGASERVQHLLERAAVNRGVRERLNFVVLS